MNITVTPSPSSAEGEIKRLWEHIAELEEQLRNILSNLDGSNFTDAGIKELKERMGI